MGGRATTGLKRHTIEEFADDKTLELSQANAPAFQTIIFQKLSTSEPQV